MKNYQSKLTFFTLMLLASLGAQAGNVASTFNDGDTLTATQMTEIKDAVNDNDANITALTNSQTISGIEFSSSDSSVQIVDTAATPTTVSTVTLTAPGPGYIKVDFSAYLTVGHTQNAGNSYIVCAIKTNATSPDASTGRIQGSRRFIPILSAEVTGSHYPHVTTTGVYQVNTAGSVTLNTICYRNVTSTSGTAFYRSLIATYHSTRY